MVNADDRLAGNRPSERHRAARRRQHGFASLSGKINTTMSGAPDDGWGSELPLYRGRLAEWPAGRRWQPRSRHGGTRNGEYAEANRHEGRHLKVSTQYLSCSRNRAWNPPTSSSLAEERTPLLVPPQHGGERFPDARSKDSHSGSLWTPARIVQALANLWTAVEGTAHLWTAVPRRPLRPRQRGA